MPDLGARLRKLALAGDLTLPPPGAGRTAERHRALLELGRADLSLAHLAEAHADALAILFESGRSGATDQLYTRHLIERTCTEVLDRFGRATGPTLPAFDPHIAQRYAELTLYIRQCHAERDLTNIRHSPV